jgi:hypothetical protein
VSGRSVDTQPAAGAADDPQPESIEDLAAAWLAAEGELASGMSGNPAQAEINARALSDRYDQAIRDASREDLRLAWEAARVRQAEEEMGSEAWANARRVSELLRDEYLAAAPGLADPETSGAG